MDEAFEAESAKVIGHHPWGVLVFLNAHEVSDMPAEVTIAEPVNEMREQAECGKERHDPGAVKLHAWYPMTIFGFRWLAKPLDALGRQDASVADLLDFQKASICVACNFNEVGEISKSASNLEVFRIIDSSLGTKGTVPFKVLLDVGGLVIDVQAGVDAVRDDPRAEFARSVSPDFPFKEELDTFGPAKVNVFSNHFFEEFPTMDRALKDLGPGNFKLPYRNFVGVSRGLIFRGEGIWEACGPLAVEGLDVLRAQFIADFLKSLGIRAGQKSVIEALVGDLPLLELPLGPFVSVDDEFDWKGAIGANLEHDRSKVLIVNVEIVMLDVDRFSGQLVVHPFTGALGAFERNRPLLSRPHKDNGVGLWVLRPHLIPDLVLVVFRLELNRGKVLSFHKILDCPDVGSCDLLKEHGGRNRLMTMLDEKSRKLTPSLKYWDIAVQVNAVHGLDIKTDVLAENFRNSTHGGNTSSVLFFCSCACRSDEWVYSNRKSQGNELVGLRRSFAVSSRVRG